LRPGIPSPLHHIGLLPDRVWGSFLRWRLAFPHAGFSQLANLSFARRARVIRGICVLSFFDGSVLLRVVLAWGLWRRRIGITLKLL